jgi:hypothetical protein
MGSTVRSGRARRIYEPAQTDTVPGKRHTFRKNKDLGAAPRSYVCVDDHPCYLRARSYSPIVAAHSRSDPGRFYKGRNVEFYIGYSVGGAYDLYARTIARHLGKHIPATRPLVPKNLEGAGSLRLANWLYNVGPEGRHGDGTIGRGTAFDPLLGSKGAQFQADKFTWIGSANNEVSICVAWNTSGITKLEIP